VFAHNLESMFPAKMLKRLLQHNRPLAEVLATQWSCPLLVNSGGGIVGAVRLHISDPWQRESTGRELPDGTNSLLLSCYDTGRVDASTFVRAWPRPRLLDRALTPFSVHRLLRSADFIHPLLSVASQFGGRMALMSLPGPQRRKSPKFLWSGKCRR
jgi:hypothetical protein